MSHRPEPPTTATTSLGYCPHCAVPVPSELLLIEYERAHGQSCYAECPACREVVRPAGAASQVGEV